MDNTRIARIAREILRMAKAVAAAGEFDSQPGSIDVKSKIVPRKSIPLSQIKNAVDVAVDNKRDELSISWSNIPNGFKIFAGTYKSDSVRIVIDKEKNSTTNENEIEFYLTLSYESNLIGDGRYKLTFDEGVVQINDKWEVRFNYDQSSQSSSFMAKVANEIRQKVNDWLKGCKNAFVVKIAEHLKAQGYYIIENE